MRILLLAIASLLFFSEDLKAQSFPNPASLSTGQGPVGSIDPIWTVSSWYSTNPPNPLGLTYGPALINNNCAPGSWVNPAALPPPVNNGNWITGSTGSPCSNNTNDGYLYFRLTLDLPSDCNGNSVATTGNYILYLDGYADNTITDIYVNGTSTGISGGSYSSPLSITLTGPWVPGVNYVDVLMYNFPNGGSSNPYGLLLVANSVASSVADGDGDGVADINDLCPCGSGNLANGCSSAVITGDTILCAGETTTLTATGSGTFFWNNGSTNSTITVNPVITTRYSVIATTSNGFQDSMVVWVTVNSLPAVGINPAAIGICEGNSTTLTATGAASYTWSNLANTSGITVSPTNTATYSVTGTDANACTATASAAVTVYTLPVAAVNPSSLAICNGASTTLTASGGTTYLWSDASTSASLTVSPTGNAAFTVTVTDANTCTALANASVTVHALPVAVINPVGAAICLGESESLTASGGADYSWSNGSNTATISVSPVMATTYVVTVTDVNTCTSTASAAITVNSLPVVGINPAAVGICEGNSTTLTATGAASYTWSNLANTSGITVSPTSIATYSVMGTDANACTATASAVVRVYTLPVAAVNPSSVAICNGASTTLTASGGTTYLWSDASTSASLTVSPTGNAAYTVTVTDANTCTAVANAAITVHALPVAVVNPAGAAICLGESESLTASGGAGYSWSNGSNTATISVSPVIATTYVVTVTDVNTCTSTASAAITVNPLPVATISPVAVTICQGESTVLTASGAISYLWNSATSTAAATVSPIATTTYSVTCTDANTCTGSASAIVTVIPAMILTTAKTDVDCNGNATGAIDLTVSSGQPPYSYGWNMGGTGQDIAGLAVGSYLVTVTDNEGCSATTSAQIAEPATLVLSSSFIHPTCPTHGFDGSITLNTAGGILPYQFNWSTGTGTSTMLNAGPGNYEVTVNDANNCTLSASFSLAYIYDFSVQASSPVSIKLGEMTTIGYSLTGIAGNYVSEWSPSSSLSCSDCVTPVATPSKTTVYQIEVKNDAGCTASDRVTVSVVPDYSVFVPNAFTPNNDGNNDVFKLFGITPSIMLLDVQLFNRAGEKVFESQDHDFVWDGTYKGSLQNPGVFIWQMKLTFIDGHRDELRKGTVTLLR